MLEVPVWAEAVFLLFEGSLVERWSCSCRQGVIDGVTWLPWFGVGVQSESRVWCLRDVFVVLPVVPRGHSLGAWGLGCHRLFVAGSPFSWCSEFEGRAFLLTGFRVLCGNFR